jgi:hypothetical protein
VSDAPPVGVKGTLLLCDFAQAVGGKLYILGGGWSKAISWGQPVSMTLAIKLDIPWHLANTKLPFEIALLTEDGTPVTNPAVGQPVRGDGQMEVGRPPGLTPGTGLDATMAIPMFGLQLAHGTYRWELKVSGHLVQTVVFEVIPPPPGFVIPPVAPPT